MAKANEEEWNGAYLMCCSHVNQTQIHTYFVEIRQTSLTEDECTSTTKTPRQGKCHYEPTRWSSAGFSPVIAMTQTYKTQHDYFRRQKQNNKNVAVITTVPRRESNRDFPAFCCSNRWYENNYVLITMTFYINRLRRPKCVCIKNLSLNFFEIPILLSVQMVTKILSLSRRDDNNKHNFFFALWPLHFSILTKIHEKYYEHVCSQYRNIIVIIILL